MKDIRTYALLIDVDNLPLDADGVFSLINQVKAKGELAYGKIYGYSERKHKGMHELINRVGFDAAPPAKSKKRGRSGLDTRMFIDAVEIACANRNIDALCFVSGDGDLVPLFAKLKELGLYVVGGFNPNEENAEMCHELVALDGKTPPPARHHSAHPPRPRVPVAASHSSAAHTESDAPRRAPLVSLRERFGAYNDKLLSELPAADNDGLSELDRLIADFNKENAKPQ